MRNPKRKTWNAASGKDKAIRRTYNRIERAIGKKAIRDAKNEHDAS